MNWLEIIIGLMSGGGIMAIITMPHQIKKAKAEAERTVADNWREFAEKMTEEIGQLKVQISDSEKRNREQYEAIMTAFGCKVLSQNPGEECPVLANYHNSKEGGDA